MLWPAPSYYIWVTDLRRTAYNKAFEMVLKLNFGDGCGCSSIEIDVPVDFKVR